MSKTNILINRIQQVDNFLNLAYFCSSWKEFTQELEEWGVYSAAKIDFDDNELVEELEDICYRIDKKLEEKCRELDEINQLKSLLKEGN